MTEQLFNTVGQGLLAIGIYTVAFESMVLSFRAGMCDHLGRCNPAETNNFLRQCKTAEKTFRYCVPKLVALGIVSSSDRDALTDMRHRRNRYAHEGYNEMVSLTVGDVEGDVRLMLFITGKVERWHQQNQPSNTERSRSFNISPAIFGMYLQVAIEIANSKLAIVEAQSKFI